MSPSVNGYKLRNPDEKLQIIFLRATLDAPECSSLGKGCSARLQ